MQDGEPTKEFVEMRYALRPLRELYGSTLAREFGPLKLKAVRQHMIDVQDLSRRVVNARVKRIKRFWKWAVSEELVPASITHGLSTVAGLRRGRTTAREAPPVKPVADIWVDLVLPLLSPQVAAMVQLQRLTGMRPCEVVIMRACDIDMSGDIWIYQPSEHKNQWREQTRIIPLGPKAQDIIRQFLGLATDRYLFSPQDAEKWRNERRAERRNPNRKTKIYLSELRPANAVKQQQRTDGLSSVRQQALCRHRMHAERDLLVKRVFPYADLLQAMGISQLEIRQGVSALLAEYGIR